MIQIEKALDEMFRYQRKSTEISRLMVSACYRTDPSDHINIWVKNDYYGVEGTIPMAGEFNRNRGYELVFFTSEPELTYDGPLMAPPFEAFKDCSKMHIGLLMNCLAFMSRNTFQRMTAITQDSKMINVDIKPMIAEQFLMYLSGREKTEQQAKEQYKLTRKGVYVNPNQVTLFS